MNRFPGSLLLSLLVCGVSYAQYSDAQYDSRPIPCTDVMLRCVGPCTRQTQRYGVAIPTWEVLSVAKHLGAVRLPPNLSLLGVGEGTRDFIAEFNKHGGHATELVQGNATALPYENGSFDYVVSHGLINNFEKDAAVKALVEMVRVARNEVRVVGYDWPPEEMANTDSAYEDLVEQVRWEYPDPLETAIYRFQSPWTGKYYARVVIKRWLPLPVPVPRADEGAGDKITGDKIKSSALEHSASASVSMTPLPNSPSFQAIKTWSQKTMVVRQLSILEERVLRNINDSREATALKDEFGINRIGVANPFHTIALLRPDQRVVNLGQELLKDEQAARSRLKEIHSMLEKLVALQATGKYQFSSVFEYNNPDSDFNGRLMANIDAIAGEEKGVHNVMANATLKHGLQFIITNRDDAAGWGGNSTVYLNTVSYGPGGASLEPQRPTFIHEVSHNSSDRKRILHRLIMFKGDDLVIGVHKKKSRSDEAESHIKDLGELRREGASSTVQWEDYKVAFKQVSEQIKILSQAVSNWSTVYHTRDVGGDVVVHMFYKRKPIEIEFPLEGIHFSSDEDAMDFALALAKERLHVLEMHRQHLEKPGRVPKNGLMDHLRQLHFRVKNRLTQ
ncbi:MAG: hypothetical protein C5B49_11640 [Bdellovibrio sp.]|nr:MAG: hypothetical protein C5B49_11640 [Bdellovibrio sp.]